MLPTPKFNRLLLTARPWLKSLDWGRAGGHGEFLWRGGSGPFPMLGESSGPARLARAAWTDDGSHNSGTHRPDGAVCVGRMAEAAGRARGHASAIRSDQRRIVGARLLHKRNNQQHGQLTAPPVSCFWSSGQLQDGHDLHRGMPRYKRAFNLAVVTWPASSRRNGRRRWLGGCVDLFRSRGQIERTALSLEQRGMEWPLALILGEQ